jgi:hypothetical protein
MILQLSLCVILTFLISELLVLTLPKLGGTVEMALVFSDIPTILR